MSQDSKQKKHVYREQYGVIVICQNERDQKRVYEELQAKFEEVKVVTT